MKKLAVALLCLGLWGGSSSVPAQSGRPSRPRVVPSPAPPTSSPSSSSSPSADPAAGGNQTKRPPVLIGAGEGNKNPGQTSPSPSGADVAAADDSDEVIRVETNLVTIPVSVLDRNGRFISGLREQDFQIFEDGVQQKIEYLAPVEMPFTVILLIDVSPSTAFRIDEIQDAAIAFVNQLRPDDRVIVMSFHERVNVLTRPTNNRATLRDAIRQTDFAQGTSLYDAVDVAISQQLRQIEGRKSVVMFTDGVDTTSRRASYQSTVRQAEELDAMIYPIRYDTSADMAGGGGGGSPYPGGGRRRRGGYGGGGGVLGTILGGIFNGGNVQIGGGGGGGGGSNRDAYEKGRRYLEDLARTSGGRAFEARSLYNVDAAFSGIAEELRRQYSIGYYPENAGQAGQRKQIKVRTNRTDAVVRAKNSYIVGSGDGGSGGGPTNAAKTTPRQPPKMSSRLPF